MRPACPLLSAQSAWAGPMLSQEVVPRTWASTKGVVLGAGEGWLSGGSETQDQKGLVCGWKRGAGEVG